MTPLLWQALIACETSPGKGRALLKELGPSGDEGLDLLFKSPLLSNAERARLDKLNESALRDAVRHGSKVVSIREYPESLASWPDNPIGLFAWGDWSATKAPTIGIVGTRGATTYGKAVATKFAEAFAQSGVTVVSGGALGIDAAAHKGAISAGGQTVAVLASGIDRIYPALHAGLFRQIRDGHGCLVSQFACGTKPDYFRFLIRNQLIAALSKAVVVVEAPERSGAISTALRANELGRQVFVVPSNIENTNFRGSHALIRDGATLVDHPDQVLEALGIELSRPIEREMVVSDSSKLILSALSTTPLAVEFIGERTGLGMNELMSELTMLEIDGYVIRDSGGYAVKP
jgi:DNA processing protein